MYRVSAAVVTLALLTACRNSPPSAPEVEISPGEPVTTDDLVAAITLDAVDDDKKDEVVYSWTWSVNGTARGDLTTATVPASETARGDTWTVRLSASDGEADVGAEASVTVGNTAPVLDSVELESASPGAADDIVVIASGSDVDEDELTYAYTWTVNGQPSDITTRRVPASATAPEETWEVTVTALDDELESDSVTLTALVGNTLPTVQITAVKPSSPSRLSTLTADVSASDGDGQDVELSYSWVVGGSELSTEPSLSASGLSVGDEVFLTVTASDGIDTSTASTAVPVVIEDLAPTVTGVSLTPSTPTKAGAVTALPLSTDPESDPVTYTYTWFVGANEVLNGTSDTLAPDSFNKGDGVRVEVVANDGYLDSARVSSGVYTVGNTPPTVVSATIPGEVSKSTGATCEGTGFADIDGDPEGYEVRWLVNGSEVSVASTLSGNLFRQGDTIVCVLTPTDGEDEGPAVTSSEVVAINALATVGSVELSPTSPTEADVITATVGSAFDPDGDPVDLSYQWYVNGSPVATTQTLSGAAFSKGDTVKLVVTPNDGIEDGTPTESSELTVVNTPPTAPELSVSPDYPNEAEDLVCLVDTPSTDADGDDVSYEISWTVDGSPWTGAVSESSLPGDTVPAGELLQDQVWSCSVTPSDDEEEGATGESDEVTILPPSNGSTQGSAGDSCKSIIELYPGLDDGVFWIDPNGGSKSDAYEVYCDMTADGGGWSLLTWTGDSRQQPYGVPLPGYHLCPDMGCLRGSVGSAEQTEALIRASSAFGKGQSATFLGTFTSLEGYQYAGQYIYGDLSTFEHRFDNQACSSTGSFTGNYLDIRGTPSLSGTVVYMGQGFKYQNTYDFTSPQTSKIWNIGVPVSVCAGGGETPGSWMGSWSPNQYGPGLRSTAGASSVWVR